MTPDGEVGARPGGHCILLIEDDADIRESLRLALEAVDYTIEEAENGAEGLRKLHALPRPCLILLDMMMPVMNGLEFLAARRDDEAAALVPVVMVTAYRNLAARAADVAGMVRKPIDLEELLRAVRQHCGDCE